MDELGKRLHTLGKFEENNKNLDPLNEERFRQLYMYKPSEEKSIFHRIKENVMCDKNTVLKSFPILNWLPKYKKTDLISDAIAGVTVGVMHIPQGMAYALLGGVPPVIGIYMAFFPVLVYIILGTSRHASMGTFAVVSMMVGKCVDQYAQTNSTTRDHEKPFNLTSVEVGTAVCLIVGIWQVILSIFRLGSLSVLLSQTLVSGFTTGAAVHVLTSQIRNLLGIEAKRNSGPFKIIYSYIDLFVSLPNLNVAATILSVSFIILLVTFNELVKPYLQKKFNSTIPFPIELLVVIAGTLLSMFLNVKERYGVKIVDSVPKGLPPPKVPPLYLLPELLTDGLIIAIVAISINISMSSIFAQKMGYEIDGNQEILASGVGNIFASFFSCMPFAASLSRSLVQVSVGGKSQLTSAFSSLLLVFILLFVGPYFEPLPYCVLSTIIVVALKGMFMQMKNVPSIFRKSKIDGFTWVVTFLSVVVLDITYGLGIGLLISVASLIFQCQNFKIVTLGYIPDTKTYADIKHFKKAQYFNNILILQIVGGLHFANCNSARKKLLTSFNKFHKDIRLSFLKEEKQKNSNTLIIDFSCVPFVDPAATESLKSIKEELKSYQADLLISGCQPSVYDALDRYNLFNDFSKFLAFRNLDDAVKHAKLQDNNVKEHGEIYVRF